MSRLGRVLCIEDDADVLTVLSFALRRHGAEAIETATDGVTGLAKARTFQPDLVLCDLMMPGVDGFEVVRQMRADDSLKNVPVIFLTAYAATAVRFPINQRTVTTPYDTWGGSLSPTMTRSSPYLAVRCQQRKVGLPEVPRQTL